MKRFLKRVIKAIIKLMVSTFYHVELNAGYDLLTMFRMGFMQRIFGFNRKVPWPVHFTSLVTGWENIKRRKGAGDLGYMPGCYIQAINGIEIGTQTRIGPGVKIVSANHNVLDFSKYDKCKPIIIGDRCWLGANCVILPGVELGEHVVVGAGAVVTKSFPDNCVIGGVPAKIIRMIEPYCGTD